jgi:uracil-DNA glycosylase
MHAPPVSGGPINSRVILIGQAPGDKEPKFGRPFAWTAGKTLFKWFYESSGLTSENLFCRRLPLFPRKKGKRRRSCP